MTSYNNNSVVSCNRPKVRLRKIYIYPQSLPKLVNHKCLWNLGKQWQVKYGFWSVDVLYSAGYTFIDIWRAIPATKLLATSSYKLGFYRYGWGSRVFRNITADSIYISIQGWLSMTQLLLERSWRSHYRSQ